jgi:hypothetical protein
LDELARTRQELAAAGAEIEKLRGEAATAVAAAEEVLEETLHPQPRVGLLGQCRVA